MYFYVENDEETTVDIYKFLCYFTFMLYTVKEIKYKSANK